MVRVIEDRPEVALGLSHEEIIDETGTQVLNRSAKTMPPQIGADEFFEAWSEGRYRFYIHITNIVRTAEAREVGGYAHTIRGMCAEDALLVKISVGRSIALTTNCTFYHRSYSTSMGQSLDYKQLAQAKREFCEVIDTHPTILEYARREPQRWARSRKALNRVMWESYVTRWDRVYRRHLPFREAVNAILIMPPGSSHYKRLARLLLSQILTMILNGLKERLPLLHQIYRVLRYRHQST
jgi:hypothetical protein